MDKTFLTNLLKHLEVLYETLIPLNKTTEELTSEFLIEIHEHLDYINSFIDELLLVHKERILCLCDTQVEFDKIFFYRDKIVELIKPLELRILKTEFTSKMFKTHSTILFERKLGFIVNKDTYHKLLSYIQLNRFESYKPEQFNIVVQHHALPYTVKATIKPKDFLNRIITNKSNYHLFNGSYIYLNEEPFKDNSVHGIEVKNYSDNWQFLTYFISHSTMFTSSLVNLSDIDNPPMNILYGNESTISSITEKDMSLHDFIKFTINKSLDSANYNKRYYLVKYKDNSYLFRDTKQLEEKAILIAKDDNALNNVLNKCKCHLIRP